MIVLADTEADISIVVPLTSSVQALRFPHAIEVKPSKKNGLNSVSVALVFQVRALDKRRLKKKIGIIEEVLLDEITLPLGRNKLLNLIRFLAKSGR